MERLQEELNLSIFPMTNPSWVQDKSLYLTVVGCVNLKRTQAFGWQDPYVRVGYGSQKFQTRTCTDGDKNPSFGDKFTIKLIAGIPEISFEVWNSNSMRKDCLIGSGKIQLTRVLSEGFDDRSWGLLSNNGRSAGDLKVIMLFEESENKKATDAAEAAAAAAEAAEAAAAAAEAAEAAAAAAAAAPPPHLQPWQQYCPPFPLPYATCLPFAPYEGYHPQQPPPARPPPPQNVYHHNVYYPPPPQHFVAPPPQQPPLPPYGYPQEQPYQPCPPPGASYPYGFCPPRGY